MKELTGCVRGDLDPCGPAFAGEPGLIMQPLPPELTDPYRRRRRDFAIFAFAGAQQQLRPFQSEGQAPDRPARASR